MKEPTGTNKTMPKSILVIKSSLVAIVIGLAGCDTASVRPDAASTDQTQASPSRQDQPISASKTDRNMFRQGISELNNGNDSKAERIFTELMRKNPALAGPYSNMALIHYKKKHYEKSIKLTEKAIKLNPKQAQAYHLRGQNLIAMGKVHEAKADYIKAIKLKPNYKNAQYNLALLYDIYLQEIELAIKHYKIYMSLLKKPDEATKDWIAHLKGTLKNE